MNYRRLAGFSASATTPRGRLEPIPVTFLALLAVVTSIARPFHRVRLCEEDACSCADARGPRWILRQDAGCSARPSRMRRAPGIEQARQRSYAGKAPRRAYADAHRSDRRRRHSRRLLDADVLEKLENDFGDDLRPLTVRHQRRIWRKRRRRRLHGGRGGAREGWKGGSAVRPHIFGEDFLAEGLASWLFVDGLVECPCRTSASATAATR